MDGSAPGRPPRDASERLCDAHTVIARMSEVVHDCGMTFAGYAKGHLDKALDNSRDREARIEAAKRAHVNTGKLLQCLEVLPKVMP